MYKCYDFQWSGDCMIFTGNSLTFVYHNHRARTPTPTPAHTSIAGFHFSTYNDFANICHILRLYSHMRRQLVINNISPFHLLLNKVIFQDQTRKDLKQRLCHMYINFVLSASSGVCDLIDIYLSVSLIYFRLICWYQSNILSLINTRFQTKPCRRASNPSFQIADPRRNILVYTIRF